MRIRAVYFFGILVALLAAGGAMVYQASLALQNASVVTTVIPKMEERPVVSKKVPDTLPPYSFTLPTAPSKPLVANEPIPAKE